jgi:hypothetical protein
LKHVFDEKVDGSDVFCGGYEVKIFCDKQQDNITSLGKKTRVEKEMAKATTCLDLRVMSVIDALSTLHFMFKISSLPSATPPPLPNRVDPLVSMWRTQTTFVTLPHRLVHRRMCANHHACGRLVPFVCVGRLGDMCGLLLNIQDRGLLCIVSGVHWRYAKFLLFFVFIWHRPINLRIFSIINEPKYGGAKSLCWLTIFSSCYSVSSSQR